MNKIKRIFTSKKITYLFLGIIVLISIITRFYKLDKYPPSITWDEAAVGYNAYTIINWGKDEWGKTLPLTFKSFGDDKNPVHVYLTAPFIGIFGLSDYATRAPSATFGVLNVIVIFFLARLLFKSDSLGLIASLFLAVSPYNLQFSRFNHELNFAIFFFIAGIYFFYKAINGKFKFLILAFLLLGIDLLTYQSAKVVTPPLVFLLIALNFKKLILNKRYFISGLIIYLFFLSLLFVKPELLGGERLKQNKISKETIQETNLYKKTNNEILGVSEVVFQRYGKYFQKQFLFVTGDTNPRHSIQTFGTFYWFDLPLLIIGLLGILGKLLYKKDKQMLVLIAWALLAPLPGAVSSELPHAARSMFITESWTMISAYGAYLVINLFKNKYYKVVMGILLILIMSTYFYKYLKSYYEEYSQKYAIEWVYGMKDVVEYVKEKDSYRAYITEIRMQPYIFFLYYLKTPLPEYLNTVKYNQTKSSPSNLVSAFGNFRFVWDEYNSIPNESILYVVSSSVYDGLFYKNDFKVDKLVKYPNGTDAFYILSPQWKIN